MLSRTGMNQGFNARYKHRLAWETFLKEEFYRLGQIFLPYVVLDAVGMLNGDGIPQGGKPGFAITGFAVSVACLIGLARGRSRMLLTPLVISGFCWSLPMRHDTAFHDYWVLLHIGIPLAFFSQVLAWMQRRFGTVVITGLAVTATLGFVLSSLQMSRVGHDAEAVELFEIVTADFEVIRRLTKGKKVLDASRRLHNEKNMRNPLVSFYLAGSILHHHSRRKKLNHPSTFDFIITSLRVKGTNLLTPTNRLVFLYEWDGFLDAYRSRSFGHLLIRSNFDVYLDGTVLRYVKNPCSREDWNADFFLHVIPVDVEDLPDHSRQYRSEIRNFLFGDYRMDLGIDRM